MAEAACPLATPVRGPWRHAAARSVTSRLAKRLYLLKQTKATPNVLALTSGRLDSRETDRALGVSNDNTCLNQGYHALNRCWPGPGLTDSACRRGWCCKSVRPVRRPAAISLTRLPARPMVATGTTDSNSGGSHQRDRPRGRRIIQSKQSSREHGAGPLRDPRDDRRLEFGGRSGCLDRLNHYPLLRPEARLPINDPELLPRISARCEAIPFTLAEGASG